MIVFNVLGGAQSIVLIYVYRAINKKRDKLCAQGISYTHEELQAMGDKAPTFRYEETHFSGNLADSISGTPSEVLSRSTLTCPKLSVLAREFTPNKPR